MHDNKLLVSIIVPVYNSEKTIARCLDSIIQQTYKAIEIIVIDDGSADASKEIISDYAGKYKNIQYYCQENSGPSMARNRGIEYASGEFLSFVDSDDSITSNAIEKLINSQMKNSSDLVIGNHTRVEEGEIETSNPVLEEQMTAFDAARYTLQGKIKVGCPGKLYRRKFILDNRLSFPNDRYGEDIYFLFKLYGCNPVISAIPQNIYVVFNTANSICNSYNYKFIYQFDTLDMIRQILLVLGKWEDCEKDYYKYYSHILHFLAAYGCRFCNREFIKEVKSKNKLPRKCIPVIKDKGCKIFIDSFIFKLNLSLYCETKMLLGKIKRKNRNWGK